MGEISVTFTLRPKRYLEKIAIDREWLLGTTSVCERRNEDTYLKIMVIFVEFPQPHTVVGMV